ncbi:hypothetical protein EST38_g4162 [Candolleomyces aberdarensis]|uniref:Uncharacterized protein n=1 Tax=Candolleomyces aberdarensis TaxID=2316362 RepID=A0A4Q2DS11_9AGAR|nr:hypothetical protein EST38_g4162 [Candolleomyces aberdarensis]
MIHNHVPTIKLSPPERLDNGDTAMLPQLATHTNADTLFSIVQRFFEAAIDGCADITNNALDFGIGEQPFLKRFMQARL